MTLAGEIKYFEQREVEERNAARTTSNGALRELLDCIADRYADLVWSLTERQFEMGTVQGIEQRWTVAFEAEQGGVDDDRPVPGSGRGSTLQASNTNF